MINLQKKIVDLSTRITKRYFQNFRDVILKGMPHVSISRNYEFYFQKCLTVFNFFVNEVIQKQVDSSLSKS